MADENKSSIELKVILLGAAGVGKTSFTNRYINNNFKEFSGTIGASFLLKTWNSHKIAIWDTSGEELYRSLSRYYCRGAGAVILAFDLSSQHSFHQLEREFVPLLEHTLDTRVVAVVGMKRDLLEGGEELGERKGEMKEREDELEKNKDGEKLRERVEDVELEEREGDGLRKRRGELEEKGKNGELEEKGGGKEGTSVKDETPTTHHYPLRPQALDLLRRLNSQSSCHHLYFETSSLNGSGVNEAFETLFTSAFHHHTPPSHPSSTIYLSSHHQPHHTTCFC